MNNDSTKLKDTLKEILIKHKKRMLKKLAGPPIITVSQVKKIARVYNLSPKEVEIAALQEEIIPVRYSRNFPTINLSEQITLLRSKVAVIGCGGLGGNIIELLARLGIGTIIFSDGDLFTESNLNRQLLCTENNLKKEKVKVALKRIHQINSSINAQSFFQFINKDNIAFIIRNADIVVDALDNIPARFILEKACKKLKIPLIHGAVNGLQGQICTIFPEDVGLNAIYGGKDKYLNKTPSNQVSVLSATPSLIASLQVNEVLKILLHKGKPLQNKLLLINLEENDFSIIEIT